MRTLQKSLCLAAVILLAGWNHPTQSSTIAEARISQGQMPSAAFAAVDRSYFPVIVAFGDSLTAGYGATAGESYPAHLQRDLDRDGYRYRVVNMGVSGNTSKDGLARVKDVLAQKPVLVIVEIGGNDGLRGLPVPVMRGNLDTILAALKRANLKIVLGGITMPPNYGANYVKEFNAVYPTLAKKYDIPLLPFILQGVWEKPELMQPDGIHPTAQGYEIVAKNFLPYVEPLLNRQH